MELDDLPPPTRPGEHFRNCLAAPVMLLHQLDGIILVFDKLHGDFEEEDVEALLSVGDQASVALENRRLQRELQQAYINTVGLLADTMEAKDPYTQGHCAQVSRYAHRTAQYLGLSAEEQSIVYYTGLLHDVGKIGVSDGVLNKPGPL
jgi:HD-GYP domain-containing protein (c-di-GMP phosphodiesterase class II)